MTQTMAKKWRWRRVTCSEGSNMEVGRLGPQALELASQLRISPLVAQLLLQRGIREPDTALKFMKPKLTDLHDPVNLPGCEQAARRLVEAVEQRQPIVVYGDYDVDGVTASAILWHMLREAGANVRCYVPHRVDEGYGLNNQAIADFARGRFDDASEEAGCISATHPNEPPATPLIVSVDCGITACEPARIAREAGCDLIITDHHEFNADGILPDACAIVHPRLKLPGAGSTYPFTQLCGAGVAFKLAWHFARLHCRSERLPERFRVLLLDLLSLAALGTVADVVPLVDENRVITRFGLGQIKRTNITGLNALIDASRLREERIDAYHVGFVLGPRLNACGRMGHAGKAVKLLTSAEPDEAAAIATFLTGENDRRRKTEKSIFDEAKQMAIEEGHAVDDRRVIVLGREGWHPGVVGIVASRMVEAFSRPAIMLCIENGEAQGSARSVQGVSIHEALTSCAEHLTTFGGHAMAAGMRLKSDGIDAFRDALVAVINEKLAVEDMVKCIDCDVDCDFEHLDLSMYEQLQQLAPFGAGNPAPTFLIREAVVDRPPRRMGQKANHLRLVVRDPHTRQYLNVVAWNFAEHEHLFPAGASVDIAFEPKLNTWQGRSNVEAHAVDIRLSGEAMD